MNDTPNKGPKLFGEVEQPSKRPQDFDPPGPFPPDMITHCKKHGTATAPVWTGLAAKLLPSLVEMHGGFRWLKQECDICHREKINAETNKRLQEQRRKVMKVVSSSPFGDRFKAATFATYKISNQHQEHLLQRVKRLGDDVISNRPVSDKHILFLCGRVGTGKTHLSESLWKHCHDNGVRCVAFERNAVLRHMKQTLSINTELTLERCIQQICSAPLLILDDFAPREFDVQSEADVEMTFELFNGIYKSRTRTFLTTNLTDPDFRNDIGPAAESRFLEMREKFAMNWADQRQLIGVPS